MFVFFCRVCAETIFVRMLSVVLLQLQFVLVAYLRYSKLSYGLKWEITAHWELETFVAHTYSHMMQTQTIHIFRIKCNNINETTHRISLAKNFWVKSRPRAYSHTHIHQPRLQRKKARASNMYVIITTNGGEPVAESECIQFRNVN